MSDKFADVMAKAVNSTGDEYKAVRDMLIEKGAFEQSLRGISEPDHSWGEAWVARIVMGWKTNDNLYVQAESYIEGKLPEPKPITGSFGVGRRAEEVAELGEDVAPRLVEIVWKTREYPDDVRLATVFAALRELMIPETAAPLRSLLGQDIPPPYRHGAITTLGTLRDAAAESKIRAICMDDSEGERARIVALGAFSKYDAPDRLQFLTAVLQDPSATTELRISAAETLSLSSEPGTKDVLHNLLRSKEDTEVLLRVVVGLRDHGDGSSLPLLHELRAKISDEELMDAIDETIEWIENEER